MNLTKNIPISRRRFLIASGWLAAGTTVVFQTGCSLPTLPTIRDNPEDNAISWIQIREDNRIVFFMGKAEMGQGVMTGLTQLVAEELGVNPKRISVKLPVTTAIEPVKMTVGSESIQDLYLPIRNAAGRLREMLKAIALKKSGAREDELQLGNGGYHVKSTGAFLSFGKIVAGENHLEFLDDAAPGISAQKEKVIGLSVPRLDIPAKVFGESLYTHDIRLPGMLYGAVLHSPVFGGILVSADASLARKMAGVEKVVIDISQNFLGVVAISDSIAHQALKIIVAKWNIPKLWQEKDIDQLLDIGRLRKDGESPHKVVSRGNPGAAYDKAAIKLEREYSTSFGTHAQMETHAGVAHVKPDVAEVWVGSQDAFYHQARIASITGLPKDRVQVYPLMLGGGFGGKVVIEPALHAARLSQVVGKPVKVVWSREENLQNSYHRPPSRHHIQAGLNQDGQITSWHHEISSGLIIFGIAAASSKTIGWVTSFIADFGGTRGSPPPYDIPNQYVRFWDETLPVPTGPWRGLGASVNAFARESLMDELAEVAGMDPLKFRLNHLSNASHPRLRRVLQSVAKLSGWGKSLPRGWGMGIACGIYQEKSFVAVVAKVRLNKSKKTLHIEKLYCAHDCGKVINPDSVKAQVEGNLVWGVGMALFEKLELKDGKMTAENFHQYKIPRITDIPDIEVVLVGETENPPSGAGEPAIMPAPAAIANAVAAAGKIRIHHLPINIKEIFQS